MSLLIDVPVNLWRLARNGIARIFRKPPDYIALEITGSLPELDRPTNLLRRRLMPGPSPVSLEKLRGILDRISADGRVRGVVLRVRNLDADWAALEELRLELARFGERGGRVVAYLIDPDTRAYYLACAADEILVTPLSVVGVTGVRTRVDFLKDALGRAGVEAEVIAVSPYKSAGDPFVRNDFSEESREQAERLLNRRFEELVEAVAEGRGFGVEAARSKIDRAPYSPPEAVGEGLIDGACYEDELPERLKTAEERATLAGWDAARGTLRLPYRRRARRKVGLVSLSGNIMRGRSRRLPVPLPFFGNEQAGDESVVGALRAAEKNRRVAAVLFHVDSRGGDALASDLIWREVERIRRKKPVVVLMGATAASGGYYVSAAANHLIARRNTITGSIGVILIRPTATGLYGKLGVNPVAVERGARSGMMDPTHRPTNDELEVLRSQLGFFYDEFKDRVSRGRTLDPGTLEGIAGGRVWTGREARELALVDEIGGFRAAVDRARELGEIKQDGPEVLVKVSPPRNTRPTPGDPVEAAREAVEATKSGFLKLLETGIWAISPYSISGD